MSDPKSLAEESESSNWPKKHEETLMNTDSSEESLKISLKKMQEAPNISFNLGPNISLKIDNVSKKEEDSSSDDNVNALHSTPPPKPKVKNYSPKLSVRQRRARLEENIKQRNKNLKDITKDKAIARRQARACEKSLEKKSS